MLKIKRKDINYRIDTDGTLGVFIFLPESMLLDIENIKNNEKDKYGGLKYGSRTHFIRLACKKLIDEEKKC